jgi:hypothetical protein
LRKAVANQRQLEKTINQMQMLSRTVLFKNVPGVARRKRLGEKVLGIN